MLARATCATARARRSFACESLKTRSTTLGAMGLAHSRRRPSAGPVANAALMTDAATATAAESSANDIQPGSRTSKELAS
jgi:uncharacterized membrane protein